MAVTEPAVLCPGCGGPAVESNAMIFCARCRVWYAKPKPVSE